MTNAASGINAIPPRDPRSMRNFGIDHISTISSNPQLWTESFQDEIKGADRRGVELRLRTAEDTMRGVAALTPHSSRNTAITCAASRSALTRYFSERPRSRIPNGCQ